MKKIIVTSIFVSFFLTSMAQTPNGIHTLWYEQPSRNWNEALPVGNGRMGAMVYGGYPDEIIQLNEESLWAGCKNESNADARSSLKTIQQLLLDGEIAKAAALAEEKLISDPLTIRSYQSVGEIIINYGSFPARRRIMEMSEYRRQLDIETGIATTTFILNGIRYTQKVFATAVDNMIVIRIKTDQAGKLNIKLSLTRKQDAICSATNDNELTMKGQIVDLPRSGSSPAGMYMKFASRIVGYNKGGKMTAVNNTFFIENAGEATFYLTAATDYNFSQLNFDRSIDPVQKCADILSQIMGKTYESVKKDHIADHSSMFNRVTFNLQDEANIHLPTDKRLEAVKEGSVDKGLTTLMFQYGRNFNLHYHKKSLIINYLLINRLLQIHI